MKAQRVVMSWSVILVMISAVGPAGAEEVAWLSGNFDGDVGGRQDLVTVNRVDDNLTTLSVWKSAGSDNFSTAEAWKDNYAFSTYGQKIWLAGDVDNDNKADVITVRRNSKLTTLYVWRSTGNGFNGKITWRNTSDFDNHTYDPYTEPAWLAGDFNGDNMTDIATVCRNGDIGTFYVWKSTGNNNDTGFDDYALWKSSGGLGTDTSTEVAWLAGDYTGDGKDDLVMVYRSGDDMVVYGWPSTGTVFGDRAIVYSNDAFVNNASTYEVAWLMNDTNADGKDDLLMVYRNNPDNHRTKIYRWLSNGNAFAALTCWKDRAAFDVFDNHEVAWLLGDYSGDSMSDLVTVRRDGALATLKVWKSDNTSLAEPAVWGDMTDFINVVQDRSVIATPYRPTKTVSFAAMELQTYLGKMGEPAKVVTANTIHRRYYPHYVFNLTTNTDARLSATDTDGHVIKDTSDDHYRNINIGGRIDNMTILYGVYTTLERLGVRWFYPGPDGEYVPASFDAVSSGLGGIDRVEIPSFKARGFKDDFSAVSSDNSMGGFWGWDLTRWMLRNKINVFNLTTNDSYWNYVSDHIQGGDLDSIGGRDYYFRNAYVRYPLPGHTFGRFIPVSQYGSSHPEYFDLINGVRQNGPEDDETTQRCTSNAAVIQIFHDTTRGYLDDPSLLCKLISITPNDGPLKWCECANCQALDRPNDDNPAGHEYDMWHCRQWNRATSDRYCTFIDAIARPLYEVYGAAHPDYKIHARAYSVCKDPPAAFGTLPPNVFMEVCQYGEPAQPQGTVDNASNPDLGNVASWNRMKGWAPHASELGVWDYILFKSQQYDDTRSTPLYFTDALFDKFKKFAGADVQYKVKCYVSEFNKKIQVENALLFYAYVKGLWNARLIDNTSDYFADNVTSFYADFCSKYYGAAGTSMHNYWTTMLTRVANNKILYGADYNCLPPAGLYDQATIQACDGYFANALAAVSGNVTLSARVQRDKDSYVYAKQYLLTPTFSLPSGTFRTPHTVTISCPIPGATIRWTNDGTDPSDTNGNVIDNGSAPVLVDHALVLKARATANGYTASSIQSAAYGFPFVEEFEGTALRSVWIQDGTPTLETSGSYAGSVKLDAYPYPSDKLTNPAIIITPDADGKLVVSWDVQNNFTGSATSVVCVGRGDTYAVYVGLKWVDGTLNLVNYLNGVWETVTTGLPNNARLGLTATIDTLGRTYRVVIKDSSDAVLFASGDITATRVFETSGNVRLSVGVSGANGNTAYFYRMSVGPEPFIDEFKGTALSSVWSLGGTPTLETSGSYAGSVKLDPQESLTHFAVPVAPDAEGRLIVSCDVTPVLINSGTFCFYLGRSSAYTVYIGLQYEDATHVKLANYTKASGWVTQRAGLPNNAPLRLTAIVNTLSNTYRIIVRNSSNGILYSSGDITANAAFPPSTHGTVRVYAGLSASGTSAAYLAQASVGPVPFVDEFSGTTIDSVWTQTNTPTLQTSGTYAGSVLFDSVGGVQDALANSAIAVEPDGEGNLVVSWDVVDDLATSGYSCMYVGRGGTITTYIAQRHATSTTVDLVNYLNGSWQTVATGLPNNVLLRCTAVINTLGNTYRVIIKNADNEVLFTSGDITASANFPTSGNIYLHAAISASSGNKFYLDKVSVGGPALLE